MKTIHQIEKDFKNKKTAFESSQEIKDLISDCIELYPNSEFVNGIFEFMKKHNGITLRQRIVLERMRKDKKGLL